MKNSLPVCTFAEPFTSTCKNEYHFFQYKDTVHYVGVEVNRTFSCGDAIGTTTRGEETSCIFREIDIPE